MKKGFTLLELLIVIGIIAILASVVALVLNPAELLRQARDGQRISDFDTLRTAINYHLSTGQSPSSNILATTSITYRIMVTGAACPFSSSTICTNTGNLVNGTVTVTSTAITGSGWVDVNFNDVGGGSAPLTILPIDPTTNSTSYYYSYAGNGSANTFKLAGRLESAKYRDKMKNDGGVGNNCITYLENGPGPTGCYYEVGTDLSL